MGVGETKDLKSAQTPSCQQPPAAICKSISSEAGLRAHERKNLLCTSLPVPWGTVAKKAHLTRLPLRGQLQIWKKRFVSTNRLPHWIPV